MKLCNSADQLQLCTNIHHVVKHQDRRFVQLLPFKISFHSWMRQLEVEGNSGDYCAELMRIFPMCPRIAAFLLQLSQNSAKSSFKSPFFSAAHKP